MLQKKFEECRERYTTTNDHMEKHYCLAGAEVVLAKGEVIRTIEQIAKMVNRNKASWTSICRYPFPADFAINDLKTDYREQILASKSNSELYLLLKEFGRMVWQKCDSKCGFNDSKDLFALLNKCQQDVEINGQLAHSSSKS